MPADWKRVPMPPQVAALDRTGGGIPITHTVAWTSERETVLKPDPLVGGRLAIFSEGAQGEGTPKLAFASTERVRQVIVAGRCQVCAETLPDDIHPPWSPPRWLVNFHKNQGWVTDDGIVPLIINAWTCESCLAYSLQVCPRLVTRRSSYVGMRILRVRAAEIVAVYERPDSIAPEDLPDPPPIGVMKIAPTDWDYLAPAEFLEIACG